MTTISGCSATTCDRAGTQHHMNHITLNINFTPSCQGFSRRLPGLLLMLRRKLLHHIKRFRAYVVFNALCVQLSRLFADSQ